LRLKSNIFRLMLTSIPIFAFAAAGANETVTYSYDPLGRLNAQNTTGTINNGNSTTITYDATGNRICYTTTVGAINVACMPSTAASGSTSGGLTSLTSMIDQAVVWSSLIAAGSSSYCSVSCSTLNGYLRDFAGSMTATAFRGHTVTGIYESSGLIVLSFKGTVTGLDSGWTSITVPGAGTLNRASARYSVDATATTWTWVSSATVVSGLVTIQ
jgi:YD repeat-containing protein